MYRILFIFLFTFQAFLSSAGIPGEYITACTDRDIYVAGENLFFQVAINSYGNAPSKSDICYLLLRNDKKVIQAFCIKTTEGKANSSVYLPDTLKTGYYELVAFTNYMRNFGESSYFTKQIVVVNRFDEWLKGLGEGQKTETPPVFDSVTLNPFIKPDRETYGLREKVSIAVASPKVLRNVSITVKEVNPYSLSILKQEHTNNETGTPDEVKYKPETSGIILYGKLLNGTDPVTNQCLFLSTPDTFANLQYSFTNEEGEFSFDLSNYYLGKNLIIAPKDPNNSNYNISLENKFDIKKPFIPKKVQLDSALRKYISESQKIVQIHKAYGYNFLKEEIRPPDNNFIPKVYYEPSRLIQPSNFIALNNFVEITDNLIEGYRVRKQNEIPYGYHLNNADGVFFNEPGAVFLNGVYIYNLSPVMNFASGDISKIEVCNETRIKGRISFPGIISIVANQKIDYKSILPQCKITRMEKFTENTTFNPPRYSNGAVPGPLPDFRQILYWNPDFNPGQNSEFSFYTSDWPSEYIVELNANTPDGDRERWYTIIKVKKL